MSKPLSSAIWRGRRQRVRVTVAAQASIRHRPSPLGPWACHSTSSGPASVSAGGVVVSAPRGYARSGLGPSRACSALAQRPAHRRQRPFRWALRCLPEGSRGLQASGSCSCSLLLLLLLLLAPRLAGPQHRRHRPAPACGPSPPGRSSCARGSPCVTRSKNAFIVGLRRTACHAASHSSFRTVAGPSPVMCPSRSLPAELSWHGTSPR